MMKSSGYFKNWLINTETHSPGSESLCIQVLYEAGEYIPVYPKSGEVLTKEEFKRLVNKCLSFYDVFDDEDISYSAKERKIRIDKELREATKYKGVVYLIKNPDDETFKIGRTNNFKNRFQSLKYEYSSSIESVHTIECDNTREAEAELHEEFNLCRVKGEWFNLSDTNVDYITSIKKYHEGVFVIGNP